MNFLNKWFDKRAKHVAVAKRYLEKQGLVIVDEGLIGGRSRFDLWAIDRSTLVVVSVRLRGCPDPLPDDVDEATPSDVQLAADNWRHQHPEFAIDSIRLDVLRLDWYAPKRQEPVLRYFPDALPVGPARRLMESISP
jgi:Holliday junction resolvase-like predicted endonuclease